MLAFLIPALAEFQIDPKASPPDEDLAAAGFEAGCGESAAVPVEGTWTEVK